MTGSWKSYSANEYVKLGIYKFEMVKDYTYIGKILRNKN